jgi:hypothetical protein
VVWLGVVSFLAWTHLLFRDEVKALSITLHGHTVFAILKELRWEGHPAVWYLLLRAAHTLVPRPVVLQLVAFVVAAIAVLILVLRAPFSLPFLALILIARLPPYAFSVMARNYGIRMLLLSLFAACYERHRDRGCLLGVVLFLLGVLQRAFYAARRRAPALLVCGHTLRRSSQQTAVYRIFLYNAALAAISVVTCFTTIYRRWRIQLCTSHSHIQDADSLQLV